MILMKKISIICLMAIIAAIGMSSCQESAEKKDRDVAFKIENNEALNADDYSRIIEYVGQYAEKAQKYVDMQINGEDAVEANEGLTRLAGEYPLLNTFRNCLKETPADKLSEDNLKEVGRYAGYIEFSAPQGYTITTDPEAAGLEVAAPEEENGVIAGAVDTLTVDRQ